MVTKEDVFDGEGNLLQEKPRSAIEIAKDKLASEIRMNMEELIHRARGTDEGLKFLSDRFVKFREEVTPLIPENVVSKAEEIEAFAGCPIPKEVNIKPPNDVNSKGRCKRIKPGQKKNDNVENKTKVPRLCRSCKEIVYHDSRNCPLRTTTH